MVEPRRKHGAFDPRYPHLSQPATPTWVLRADAGLEWTAFLARFFPGRGRHDIEALAAYGAYRNESRQPSLSPAGASRGGFVATAHGPKRLQPALAPTVARTRPTPLTAIDNHLSASRGRPV
jgi:hypothetical protein